MTERSGDAWVVFNPSGKRGRFPLGTNLLAAARTLGVDLDSVCGGRGICGRCRILVHEGESAAEGIQSDALHLSPISEPEKRYARSRELGGGQRLSCHATIEGDCIIDVPAESQVHRQVIRKAHQSRDIELDPIIHLHFVEIEAPRLDRPSGDLQRLLRALEEEWGLADLSVDARLLPELQPCLREGEWKVTVAVREGREVMGLWPGLKERVLGLALDIGSTTLAGHLCDLIRGDVLASGGVMNPQIRFGEDLMSRISHAANHPGSDREMTRVVHEAVDAMLVELTSEVGATPEDVLEIVFVGNPAMHHLFLGLNPVHLGLAPFALVTDGAVSLRAAELGLSTHPAARVYALPCIAGHVGADAAGMLLAEAPWQDEGVTLLVDVGTNAEIVLSFSGRLLAASSPTGPAFEGAEISCGQRATAGAIERVRIDPDTLEPRFGVIGCEAWSDAADFGSELGAQGVTGLCGTGIIEAIAELFRVGVIRSDGRIAADAAERSSRVVREGRTYAYRISDDPSNMRITQLDIRAIQLAKAALYGGIRLLMEKMGVDRVDRIRLAGAFGNQIDVQYAMMLGMIPDCDLDRVSSAGNAAGTGAVMALLSRKARATIEEQARRVEKAVEESFQEYFMAALAFPHATDSFPELSKRVVLPESSEAG